MENGELRLQGLIRPEDEPSEEELDTLREELLAGTDPNAPSWSATVASRIIKPDAFLSLDFGSEPNSPVPIEVEKRRAKIRRIIWSIFN